MPRADGREASELRSVSFELGVVKWAEGSCIITQGDTKVLCCATVDDTSVPPFAKGHGWITAEYSLLPRSTAQRTSRTTGGRAYEIQRLIGRSLRASCDLSALGERTVVIDCDVIQADGGTRCASITGGFIALFEALHKIYEEGRLKELPVKRLVAAVSVGMVNGEKLLDLTHEEDSNAQVDMNIVAGVQGNELKLIEVQGTAEGEPFSIETMNELMKLAFSGIEKIVGAQREILSSFSSTKLLLPQNFS